MGSRDILHRTIMPREMNHNRLFTDHSITTKRTVCCQKNTKKIVDKAKKDNRNRARRCYGM